MDLKNQIFLELHNKPRTTLLKDLVYDFGPLEEISTIDLPFLTIPFLNASLLDRRNRKEEAVASFKEYNSLVEELGIVKPLCIKTREDKIKLYNLKKSFSFDFVDWEDRTWLLKLLEHFYVKSLETLKFLEFESKNVEEKKYHPALHKKIVTYHLALHKDGFLEPPKTVSFKRKDLLKRRINPKYTLEEFGDVLVERLKKLEKQPVVVKEEITLKDLRKRDDERDDCGIGKGNTKNIG